jgi:glycosyltransferase involved in cell wall biosynthesis
MRILLLLDDTAELDGEVRLADDEGFVLASARRDLVRLVPLLDRSRIQPTVIALRGGENALNAQHRLDFAALRRLRRLLWEQDIELIHALGKRAVVYAALAGRWQGIPTLASLYDLPFTDRQTLAGSLLQRAYMRLMRWGIDRVIVPSELFKRDLLTLYSLPDRIYVVYPGIEIGVTPPPVPDRAALGLPEGPLVTMIAPMVEGQGHEVVLEAYQRLLQRVPVANLAIVGTGPLRYNLFKQAAKIHPPNPITWIKELDSKAVIAASTVVVVHSRKEGLPQALIEAAAAGKPAIATRTAGAMEIIDPGITGFLTTAGDARDLAIQIGKFMLQPAFAEQVGRTAHERARKRFSLDAQCETMTTLYEATIYASR